MAIFSNPLFATYSVYACNTSILHRATCSAALHLVAKFSQTVLSLLNTLPRLAAILCHNYKSMANKTASQRYYDNLKPLTPEIGHTHLRSCWHPSLTANRTTSVKISRI